MMCMRACAFVTSLHKSSRTQNVDMDTRAHAVGRRVGWGRWRELGRVGGVHREL